MDKSAIRDVCPVKLALVAFISIQLFLIQVPTWQSEGQLQSQFT
jgi:hypothetical protein